MNGVLLIHGFAGSREEIASLRDYLAARGFIVSAPCLTGHEGTRKQLAAATYHDWITDVQKAMMHLRRRAGRFSSWAFLWAGFYPPNYTSRINLTGSSQSTRLSITGTLPKWLKNLHTDFKTYWKQYFSASATKPFRTLFAFQRLLSKTKPLFREIVCPTLVIQVQDDDTVNAHSGNYIFRSLAGKKQYYKPVSGGHILLQSDAFRRLPHEFTPFMQHWPNSKNNYFFLQSVDFSLSPRYNQNIKNYTATGQRMQAHSLHIVRSLKMCIRALYFCF